MKLHVSEFHYSLSTGSDFGLKRYKNPSREDIRTLRSLAADGARVGEMLIQWQPYWKLGSAKKLRSVGRIL